MDTSGTCSDTAVPAQSEESQIVYQPKGISCFGLHSNFALFLDPCLNCNSFCNCYFTYFQTPYPDVLLRSLDKQIVRISKHVVRASKFLSEKVDSYLMLHRQNIIKTEEVILTLDPNSPYSVIKYKQLVGGQGSDYLKNKQNEEHEKRSTKDIPDEPIEFGRNEMVLVLFDREDDVPSVGIKRNTLLKINYFMGKHLEEVEQRVEKKKRDKIFNDEHPERFFHMRLEDSENSLNSFAYEDWEEEFFSMEPMGYMDLIQANQDLLIWDLFFSLEKWLYLGRGFPAKMENGWYDYTNDPDFMNWDNKNHFGLFGVEYDNPRKQRHRQSRWKKNQDVTDLTPVWWSIVGKE